MSDFSRSNRFQFLIGLVAGFTLLSFYYTNCSQLKVDQSLAQKALDDAQILKFEMKSVTKLLPQDSRELDFEVFHVEGGPAPIEVTLAEVRDPDQVIKDIDVHCSNNSGKCLGRLTVSSDSEPGTAIVELLVAQGGLSYQKDISIDVVHGFPRGTGQWVIRGLTDIDIDMNGNVYVTSFLNHRVFGFDQEGYPILNLGSRGTGDGQFINTDAVHVDDENQLYVIDQDNSRVQVFDSAGNHVMTFGGEGESDGLFRTPNDIAVNADGEIHVVDTLNHRIQVFDSAGTHIRNISEFGSEDDQLRYPVAVSFGPDERLYVLGRTMGRVHVFDAEAEHIMSFGSEGSEPGQFIRPSDLAVASDGTIYVLDDAQNNRIQIFDNDGGYISSIALEPQGSYSGIALDGSDNLHLVARKGGDIKVFDKAGTFLRTLNSTGSEIGEFSDPRAMALSESGDLFIVDRLNHRVQVFDSYGDPLLSGSEHSNKLKKA